MKNIVKICFVFLGFTPSIFAQNVGINASGAIPDASAMLDVDVSALGASAKKGVLFPRVSLTSVLDITTIPSPATSLYVYNTATAGTSPNNVVPGFYYWNGTKWIAMSGNGGNDWSLIGNAGTSPSGAGYGTAVNNNFLGTLDAQDLTFVTNGMERMRIKTDNGSNLRIGMGTAFTANYNASATSSILHLNDWGTTANDFAAFNLSNSSTTVGNLVGVINFAAAGATGAATIDRKTSSIESNLTALSGANVSGDLRFFTNNASSFTEKMRIMPTGEVVVNSTTPVPGDVLSAYGTYAVAGYGSGNNSIAGYFSGGSGSIARGVVATSASANGFGIVAGNSNLNGTGILSTGNNVGGVYLTAGSGGAFRASQCGVFSILSNTNTAGGGYGLTMNNGYSSVYGEAEVNVSSNTQLYHFGTEGFMYISGGTITRHRRVGGVLGMSNITNGGNPIWGSLAYNNSGGTTYSLFYTSTGGSLTNVGGKMASGSSTGGAKSAIGMGGYGDLMGGWIRGNVYGLEVKGERYSLYVDGKAYTNDIITQLTENGTQQKSVSYVSTSTKVDISDRGMAKLVNGEATVTFSEDFASVISSSELPMISITPYGETNGLYVSQVNKNSFTVKENGAGKSNINFVWNVTAIRKGYETVAHPQELLDINYDSNMNDVMYHEGKNGTAKPIYWDGANLKFEEQQGNGNLKLETIDDTLIKKYKDEKTNNSQKNSTTQNQ